jgi:hypothetical protein
MMIHTHHIIEHDKIEELILVLGAEFQPIRVDHRRARC